MSEVATLGAWTPPVQDTRPGYVAGDMIAGKYRLVRVVGQGGMGAVWLARNTVLEVDVAIKLIRRYVASDDASARLLQEARAAARLGHPSIVRIFDFGQTDRGDPFIVMEVLEGDSLGDVLARRGRLPALGAVRTLLPVASALEAAHAKGIVHRDMKPDNVVLVPDESGGVVPKVVDFGIAKLGRDDVNRLETQAGAVLGSPDYMSPEQARGRKDIDHRADVWALAVMLYEALTGRRPFAGHNYNALMMAVIDEAPTPITEFAAGDAALWAIVEKGLAKDAADRWPSMRTFGAALATWAIDQGATDDVAGRALRAQWLAEGEGPALEPRDKAAAIDAGLRRASFHEFQPLDLPSARATRVVTPPANASPAPSSEEAQPTPRAASGRVLWPVAALAVALGCTFAYARWREAPTPSPTGAQAPAVATEKEGTHPSSPPPEPTVSVLPGGEPTVPTATASASAVPAKKDAKKDAKRDSAPVSPVSVPVKPGPSRTAAPGLPLPTDPNF